jgi:hypothetical protein
VLQTESPNGIVLMEVCMSSSAQSGTASPLRTLVRSEWEAVGKVWAHQQFSGRNTELLICVDELGSIEIDHTEGARGNASLTAGMLALLKGKQKCRLWHNHPSGGSLSVDDLRLMLSFPDIVEIAAVNANGSLFRGAVRIPAS